MCVSNFILQYFRITLFELNIMIADSEQLIVKEKDNERTIEFLLLVMVCLCLQLPPR